MTTSEQARKFLADLRRENAALLGITENALVEGDLHELEESIGLDDAELLPPPRTTRGGYPTSALYRRETKTERKARRAEIDKLLKKFEIDSTA